MAIQKTEAIVIKTQPFRSSSLIITFFSKTFGKLKGIAKGVRQEREMRGAVYELFTHLEIIFYEKLRSDLHLVSEAFLIETYEPVRTDLESIAHASYFAELVDELCEVHDPHERLFELLDFCYRYLSSVPGKRISRLFEIKLLNEIGWLPFLKSCLKCGADGIESGFFSARQGALLCTNCAHEYPDASPLSAGALKGMRYYIRHDFEEALRFPLSKPVEAELEGHMERFLLDRLSKPMKSRIFLQKISPTLVR